MSDMYGALRSNVFKVKDVEAFEAWFSEHVTFSGWEEGEVWANDEGVALGSTGQYPNAFPQIPRDIDSDHDQEEWNLEAFAVEMRKHLLPGEEFRVLAAGNEKLRYVAATHLIITHDKAEFRDYYEGN